MTENQQNLLTTFDLIGTDVIAFLNNQVVTELNNFDGHVCYTAICNPKGRIIFSLFIFFNPEKTTIAVDSELSDNFFQYLNMRRFRMNVQIKKSTHACNLSNNDDESFGLSLIAKDDVNYTPFKASKFWLHMFQLNLPWINAATSEQYIPQHVNMDQKGITSFNKGCYPGQEIIARLHFLGKIKKQMKHITYQAQTASKPTASIELPGETSAAELCAPSIYHNGMWHAQAIFKL